MQLLCGCCVVAMQLLCYCYAVIFFYPDLVVKFADVIVVSAEVEDKVL